jgi:hypothetical protein
MVIQIDYRLYYARGTNIQHFGETGSTPWSDTVIMRFTENTGGILKIKTTAS